jgi:ATP-binding cassette subfamily F protein 3
MKALIAQDLSLSFGDRTILDGVNISIHTGHCSALVGMNGSGKSSLMKILSGILQPDAGTIHQAGDVRVSYLSQTNELDPDIKLYTAVEEGFAHFKQLESNLRSLDNEISQNSDSYTELLNRRHEIEEQLLASKYYSRERYIFEMIQGLGFKESDLERKCREFSGGWQMRIALAQILAEEPDIMLLDEPTNYLDLETREWLQNSLKSFTGGLLIVSHDRNFLEEISGQVIELRQGSLKTYKGSYSHFEIKQKEELASIQKQYQEQQLEIEKLESFIQKFRYNASKASLVQSRVKQLEKIQRIQIPEQHARVQFQIPTGSKPGKDILQLSDVTKSYDELEVLQKVNLHIGRGDRIAVTGVNGSGKSTLIKIITHELTDFSGERTQGTGVQIGYYRQEPQPLPAGRTIIEFLEEECPSEVIPLLRNLLGGFLFRGDDIYKDVSVLSGGERSRLELLRILLSPVNFLILDEPTNHLDIQSKDILLEALKSYSGTLVFVSHDRYFLESLATRIVDVSSKPERVYEGDYEYYRYRLNKEIAVGLRNTESESDDEAKKMEKASESDFEKQKQIRNRVKSLQKKEEELLSAMDSVDRELLEFQAKLEDPEVYSSHEQSLKVQENIAQLEEKHRDIQGQWEDIALELENIQSSS